MKKFLMIALFCLPLSILAQRSGDTKDIDGQKFTYNGSQWVHDSLGSSFSSTKQYSAVYRDKTWQKWYREGSPTLKKILDLGPNVAFKYKGADGQYHTYTVFSSKAALGGAAGGGTASHAGLSKGAWIGIGAAVVVAGVIIANKDDKHPSGFKR